MEYFIFNGTKSSDMNIVIKKLPSVTRAKQRINTITLEGRSGTLHEIEDKFDSYNISIECVMMPDANTNNIKKWLLGQSDLILSNNLGVKYTATVVNKIDFSKYLEFLKEFILELEIQPIAYGLEEKIIEINANQENSYNINGNYKTYPLIKVEGNGSITCNGNTLIIDDNDIYLYIDCELMNAYINNNNKNDSVNGLENPLFLIPGNNVITTVNVAATIYYREAWL